MMRVIVDAPAGDDVLELAELRIKAREAVLKCRRAFELRCVLRTPVDAERSYALDAHLAEDVHRRLGAEETDTDRRRVADGGRGRGVVPDEPTLLVELAQNW